MAGKGKEFINSTPKAHMVGNASDEEVEKRFEHIY